MRQRQAYGKRGDVAINDLGELAEGKERNVPLATLDLPNKGTINAGLQSEGFLRNRFRLPRITDPLSQHCK